MRPAHAVALAVLGGSLATVWGTSAAQEQDPLIAALSAPEPGAEANENELLAWAHIRARKYIKARELAERIVEQNPTSYVAHMVLGFAHHYGEANFPRALFHHNRALGLFELRFGREPQPGSPWRWHSRLLRELADTHGALEHYEDRLGYIGRYNALYDPDILAERAWALMKLGRFSEARLAARQGMATGDDRQKEIALNALCAVEFEAGNDGTSYEACQAALDYALTTRGRASAVDYTNFAEAARSVFKLAEAETMLMEATKAPVAWYGNPWLELAELYTRGARYPEALSALKEVPRYRAQRPPHVQDADRNESMRALSSFFLLIGRPREALRITEKALVEPDRRAHNSRDPAQDRAVIALLDRRARRVVAGMLEEEAAAGDFGARWSARLESLQLHAEAWLSGRQAVRLLSDEDRMIGTFRIGTARAAIVPPWLVGELVEVAGPGIVRQAVHLARAEDERRGAAAYYDAFLAEAAFVGGDDEEAIAYARTALDALPPGEAILAARVELIRAVALHDEEGLREAKPAYEAAYQRDPGAFRLLGVPVPVRVRHNGGEVAEAVADALERSPRLSPEAGGFVVTVSADATAGRVCLNGSAGAVLGCASATFEATDDVDELVRRILDAFHRQVFAARVDLSQADIGSLDGSNLSDRNAFDSLFDSSPGEVVPP